MAINLTEKTSPKVVERFKQASYTEGLFTSNYDWTGVATVKVYSVDTVPLQNYDKTATTGSRFGTMTELGDSVQEMTVTQDKSFNASIDKGNNTSQLMIKAAGTVMRRQTDEVIIPYVDKYRLGVMARDAGLVYTQTSAVTSSNVVERIMLANAAMGNEHVPKSGRVLYIGETKATQLKLANQVMGLEKTGTAAIVNGAMGQIDGVQVRVVPDNDIPTGVDFLIILKGCACAPKKIETYRILENHPDIDGHVVQGRLLHDCFVLDTKANGVLVATILTQANGGGATYKRVINPTGNPYTSGWYKRGSTGAFTACASTETTVAANTVYYEQKA